MSLSSRVQKVRPKGTVKELKIVHSINRRGQDTLKAEEVLTPSKKAPPSIKGTSSSPPTKRQKVEALDWEGIECNLEEPDVSQKRQTLVRLSPMQFNPWPYLTI